MLRNLIILLLLTTVGLSADFQQTLSKVAAYNYGDSRETLSELSDMLRQASGDAVKLAAYESAMLKVLAEPKTTFAAKQYLCKELSIMGSEASVPTLSKMLYDPKTADIARYALERIPGAAVDRALLKAAVKTKGLVQIGVINSLGERRTPGAEKTLGKLLKSKDPQVVSAAAAALGKIGTPAAAELLAKALNTTTARPAVADAYLRAADHLSTAGMTAQAEAAYRRLFDPKEALPLRCAALIGLVRTVNDPTALILQVLQNEPAELKAVAASLIHQCKRPIDLKAIAAELKNFDPQSKVQVLTAFRIKGDAVVRGAVLEQIDDPMTEVNVAAVAALSSVGTAEDVNLLARLAAEALEPVKSTAKESLAKLKAPGTDEQIIAALENSEGPMLTTLIEAIGDRNMDASAALLRLTRRPELRVRVAAFKALGQVAKPDDLPRLIDALILCSADADRREAERAVTATAKRIPEPDKQGDAVILGLQRAGTPVAKASLMLVLGRIGDPDGLPILQAALKSKDPAEQRAAILALSEWPTPAAVDDLLNAAKTLKDESLRILALRGFIAQIGLPSERSAAETTKLYQTALELAANLQEMRMAMSGLAKVHSVEAFDLAAKYLEDPQLKAEAELAVLENAGYLGDQKTEARKAVIRKIGEGTQDERIKRAVEYLLQ
ncbi:MAG: HEAT repeat domain-containing protein [candidate division KSB1 bacterium]|nr:HEAT repeat domain-containing protein [candidate division KSB1 bacterium]